MPEHVPHHAGDLADGEEFQLTPGTLCIQNSGVRPKICMFPQIRRD